MTKDAHAPNQRRVFVKRLLDKIVPHITELFEFISKEKCRNVTTLQMKMYFDRMHFICNMVFDFCEIEIQRVKTKRNKESRSLYSNMIKIANVFFHGYSQNPATDKDEMGMRTTLLKKLLHYERMGSLRALEDELGPNATDEQRKLHN